MFKNSMIKLISQARLGESAASGPGGKVSHQTIRVPIHYSMLMTLQPTINCLTLLCLYITGSTLLSILSLILEENVLTFYTKIKQRHITTGQ